MFTLSARVVPPVLFTRRGRALRTHSAVGLAALSDQERRTGRVLILDLLGVSWFSRGIYLDSFYGTIDDEYAAFAALPFPRDDKKAIAPRVAAAIRTIALFSAWYPVIWRFVARGFIASVVAAVVAAVWVALAALGPHPSALAVVFAAGLTFLALVVAGRLVLRLPRRWPRDVLTLVVAGAACATLAQILFAHRPPSWPWPGVLAAATAVAVVCLVNAAVLTVAQALSQRVTWRKISEFPEEEIIQTTAFVLSHFEGAGARWRVPEERAQGAENLEWIARRFELNLTTRYASAEPASDAVLSSDAARYAAAFRARKRDLVFPGAGTPAHFKAFMWEALRLEALGRWGELPRATPQPAAATRALRALEIGQTVLAIAIPAAIAFVVQQMHVAWLGAELQRNIVLTGIGWSLLSLLATVNPRQFERQASTAKTLGDLLKRS